ncbi:MAG TPA: nuclear transport factor 2 family protein [Anaerolineales bacterium]|nr:nuclear transport factor 2 family protein [Anaerolineales bacterium]
MMDATEAVLIANENFYRALSLADLGAMQRVWLASEDAVCLHPGWPPLHGWKAIHASWERIFENQGPLHVWPSDAEVRLFGQTAEVTCIENIDTARIAGSGVLQTRATNIFRLVSQAWKMLEHHAVSLPAGGAKRVEPFSSN